MADALKAVPRSAGGAGRGRLGPGRVGGVSVQPLTFRRLTFGMPVGQDECRTSRGDLVMNRCDYACDTADHAVSRRSFLGAAAAGFAGSRRVRHARGRPRPGHGRQARARHLPAGGVSQLETWDPKPGTDTGGPFRAIPTSVPGIAHLRAAAAHREADAPPGPRPRHQHRRGRPRPRGRRSCTPAGGPSRASSTRTSAPSRPSCSGPARRSCPATSTSRPAAAAGSTSRTPPSSARGSPR